MLLNKSHVVLTALQTQRQNPALPASGRPHQHTLLHRDSSMAKRPQIASCAYSQRKEAFSNTEDSLLYAAMSESMANLQHAPNPYTCSAPTACLLAQTIPLCAAGSSAVGDQPNTALLTACQQHTCQLHSTLL